METFRSWPVFRNVKALTSHEYGYRMRVGDWRILFDVKDRIRIITIQEVKKGDAIPREVVGLTIKKGYTLVHTWREYLRLTQTEVAERMGITQAALSQMESGRKRLREKKGTTI